MVNSSTIFLSGPVCLGPNNNRFRRPSLLSILVNIHNNTINWPNNRGSGGTRLCMLSPLYSQLEKGWYNENIQLQWFSWMCCILCWDPVSLIISVYKMNIFLTQNYLQCGNCWQIHKNLDKRVGSLKFRLDKFRQTVPYQKLRL